MFYRNDKVVCLRDFNPKDSWHPDHTLIPWTLTKGRIYCVADVWASVNTSNASGVLCELAGQPMPINPSSGNKFGWSIEWFALVNRCEDHAEACASNK